MNSNKVVKLSFGNNVKRENLGEYTFSSGRADFLPFVYEHLEKSGYSFNKEFGQLLVEDKSLHLLSDSDWDYIFGKEEINVRYLDIVAPCNEANVDYYEGITFFFHTKEQTHLGMPHVHAEYSGNEISICIEKGKLLRGKFKGHYSKGKLALKRVESRKDFFMEEWYKWVANSQKLCGNK